MLNRFIFWTFVDDILEDFIILNKPLQNISKNFNFYALCSGEKSVDLINNHYHAKIINTENNLCLKANILFNQLKHQNDFDVLIKIDLDALIMNITMLTEIINAYMEPMGFIGNCYSKRDYIRGGCNATHVSAIHRIEMEIPDKRYMDFDGAYNRSLQKIGIKYIKKPLFEINRCFNKRLPVWHPIKGEKKLEYFKEVLRNYETT